MRSRKRDALDIQELNLDEVVLLGEATRVAEDVQSFVITALVDEPPRREWHEVDTDGKNDSGNGLKREWETPGCFL